MANCKDCVHAEVCRFKDLPAPLSDSYIRESECIEKRCGNFKDRSRFVELPCRPDDSLFVIVPDRNGNPTIEEYTVYAVIKKRDKTILETGIGRFTWGKEPCWLSYEEAKRALREREA